MEPILIISYIQPHFNEQARLLGRIEHLTLSPAANDCDNPSDKEEFWQHSVMWNIPRLDFIEDVLQRLADANLAEHCIVVIGTFDEVVPRISWKPGITWRASLQEARSSIE